MAEMTGFEGPKCKACGSRNTGKETECDSRDFTVNCYDCGFDAYFDYNDGQFFLTPEDSVERFKAWREECW
jgi:hypothetical protein